MTLKEASKESLGISKKPIRYPQGTLIKESNQKTTKESNKIPSRENIVMEVMSQKDALATS